MYGGILLPPTRKINYVKMHVSTRVIYVGMQHNFVDISTCIYMISMLAYDLSFVACQHK